MGLSVNLACNPSILARPGQPSFDFTYKPRAKYSDYPQILLLAAVQCWIRRLRSQSWPHALWLFESFPPIRCSKARSIRRAYSVRVRSLVSCRRDHRPQRPLWGHGIRSLQFRGRAANHRYSAGGLRRPDRPDAVAPAYDWLPSMRRMKQAIPTFVP